MRYNIFIKIYMIDKYIYIYIYHDLVIPGKDTTKTQLYQAT